jgi:hypothetical protein
VKHGQISALIVASDSPSPTQLFEDLAPRVGDLTLHDFTALDFDASAARLFAFVRVREEAASRYEIDLVLSDGRAYLRKVEAEPDQQSRAIASALANLVAAIDEDAVAPDREDVPLPALTGQEHGARDGKGERSEPGPAQTEEVEGGRDLEGENEAKSPQPPARTDAGIHVGLTLHAGPIFGLVPAPADYRAFGGGIATDFRFTGGAFATVDARLAGHRADGLELLRWRFALGGGYNLQRRRFDMPMALLAWIEPWAVRTSGDRIPLNSANGSETRGSALLGLGLRVSPGFRTPVGRRSFLRIGARVELGTSAQFADGPKAVRILMSADDPPSFRLGGLETKVGLELGVDFGLRSRSDDRRGAHR